MKNKPPLRGEPFVSEFFLDLRVLVPSKCGRCREGQTECGCHPKPVKDLNRPAKAGVLLTYGIMVVLPIVVGVHPTGCISRSIWMMLLGAIALWLILLPFAWRNLECRACRYRRWKAHADQYATLCRPKRLHYPGSLPGGTHRIDFLGGHLKVLDTKFAAFLQFHALLVAAMILLGRISLPGTSEVLEMPAALVPGIVIAVFFITATMLSLRSLSRVQWGNMTLEDSLVQAELQQVNWLIGSVVRRTAWLRLAAFVTVMNIFIMVTILVVIVIAVVRSPSVPGTTPQDGLVIEASDQDLTFSFASGDARCEPDGKGQAEVDKFVEA